MKVLHLTGTLRTGGAETMLAKLLQARAPSHDALVVSLTGDGPIGERIRALGLRTELVGMRRGIPDPRGIAAVARLLRRYRPDVVQTWIYHSDLIGGLAAQISGRPPVVWNIRNAELPASSNKVTTRATLKACALLSKWLPRRIVTCSQRARDVHVAAGYDAERMVVIPNGFDLASFSPPTQEQRNAVRHEIGIPADALVVGMVARYDPMKDFQNFARAAGFLTRAEPRAHFVLCGDGITEENRELLAWLRDAGVLDRTKLLGRRGDVNRILRALDLFTLSSVSEGFPNALGEAMAAAVACVTTDVGDCKMILGDAGRVVPPRDPDALFKAWHDVIALGPTQRAELGTAGRRRVASSYSIDGVAVQFAAMYSQIIQECR
jgi:glycosyltransferase involved in cell wall biosynthesis